MESLPRFRSWKNLDTLTVDDKMEMLDFMKVNLLLLHAVKELGYMENPEVVKANDDFVNREARQEVNSLLKDQEYEPTEEEVESYFDAHRKDYTVERKLLVYHIIFQDSLQAEAVRDSLLLGAKFEDMAKRYYPGEPEIREVKLGAAEVRAVFPVSKGFVAGCLVTEGRVQVFASARLRRGGKVEAPC